MSGLCKDNLGFSTLFPYSYKYSHTCKTMCFHLGCVKRSHHIVQNLTGQSGQATEQGADSELPTYRVKTRGEATDTLGLKRQVNIQIDMREERKVWVKI